MLQWHTLLVNGRTRAQPKHLEQDCHRIVARVLDIVVSNGRDDSEIAAWAKQTDDLDNDPGSAVRSQWARSLQASATEATGGIWTAIDEAEAADVERAESTPDDPANHRIDRYAAGVSDLVDAVLDHLGSDSAYYQVERDHIAAAAADHIKLRTTPNDGPAVRLALSRVAMWEWLGGFFPQVTTEHPGPEWEVLARFESGHRHLPDGSVIKEPAWMVSRPWAPPRYLLALGVSLWESQWRAEAKRAFELSKRENALTVRTVESVVGLLSSATHAHLDGETLALIDPDGARRGEIDLLSLRDLLQRNKRGGGVVTPEVVRATAEELIRARHTVAGVHAFTHAVQTVTTLVRSGHTLTASWAKWKEWAEEVADHAEVRLTPDLRRALYSVAWFGNVAQMQLFDGRTQRGFWTLSAPDPFRRGRRRAGESQVVDFSYAPVLSPEWVHRENPNDKNRGVRLLYIPPRLPVGSRINANQKAQAQLFTLLVLSRIAKHTEPRRVADGAVLTPDDLSQLARLAGLSVTYIGRQIAAMQDAGLVEQVNPTRFSLAGEEARQLAAYRKKPPRRRSRKGR